LRPPGPFKNLDISLLGFKGKLDFSFSSEAVKNLPKGVLEGSR
jgi:hypothetical protein